MPRVLKVFRTSTGFHDAYVAAPSRAAALRAWGSDNDLFARGAAEEVDDPKLTAEPLAHPGEVIRKSRGSLAEQIAALPEDKPVRKRGAPDRNPPPATKPGPVRPKPRPNRATLDRAETAAKALEAEQRDVRDALAKREAALRDERKALEAEQDAARERAVRAIDKAKAAYDAAVEKWRA